MESVSHSFQIKTPVFEGPLDLLLSLIEKRKLLINDISLAKVTDDYIEHINNKEAVSVIDTTQFVLIASTLLLIKSKSLLPNLSLTEEESESIEDLEARLKLYKRMKELSHHVADRFGQTIMFPASLKRSATISFSPSNDTTKEKIIASIKTVLNNLPKKEYLAKAAVEKVVSLEEMIDELRDRIAKNLSMSFKEFSNIGKKEKVHVIVSFLAMLELVKQGIVQVAQQDPFADITIEHDAIERPRYD